MKVDPCHVKADLMGEWRLLRNWIIHRSRDAEDDFFERAKSLATALGLQRGNPSLTADNVLNLMARLNNMRIEVNPPSLEMGIAPVPSSPETIAAVARTLEPGAGAIVPVEAAMFPSPAIIVFDEAVAVIHENDCSQRKVQLQSSREWRQLKVLDRWVASSVVELLEQKEQLCRECGANPS